LTPKNGLKNTGQNYLSTTLITSMSTVIHQMLIKKIQRNQ